MIIKPNSLLPPNEMSIKPYNREFIAVDGPTLVDSLFLDDIAIGYSDFFISRMVLSVNATNVPLYFEGLEQELIFLLIRVRKDIEADPNFVYDETINSYNSLGYITYYFTGFTGETYSIGELFIQTGSYNLKIPTICLNNPNGYDVVLDIMGAVLDKPAAAIPSTGTTTYQNLYSDDIISDEFLFVSVTGSTALQILISGITIPYTGITSGPTKNIDDLTLTIVSDSRTYILNFLTEFDFYQAYSRILWVMSSPQTRFLNPDYVFENNSGYTGYDTSAPIIYYFPSGTTVPSGSTLGMLTKNEILQHFISGVTDFWDGDLLITGATSTLNKLGSPVSLTGISEESIYEISFTYYDNAKNSTGATIENIYTDITPPIIHYNYGIINSGITGITISGYTGITSGMTIISGFTMVVSGRTPTGITNSDIRDFIIDRVTDNVDVLTKYNISFYKQDIRGNLIDVIADPYYTETLSTITIPSISGISILFTGNTNLYWVSGDTAYIKYDSQHNFIAKIQNYDYTTGVFNLVSESNINGSGATHSSWIVDYVLNSGSTVLDFFVKLSVSDRCQNNRTDYLILRTLS